MDIRKGLISDIDNIENLYNNLNDYLETNINYPGWIKHVYPTRDTAIKGIEEESLFILEDNSIILGSVILNHKAEDAYSEVKWKIDTDYNNIIVVHTLVTNPDFINQGVASELMNFAKKYSSALNMKSIRLDVSINNTAAISLYEKHGYQYIGTVDLGLEYEHLKWFRLYELIL